MTTTHHPSAADEFLFLDLVTITPSPTNPRKHFDPAKLQDLAASIKASGVHQPILVRPLPGSRVADTDRKVAYELVCGERRYRASTLAQADSIPALIRTLTDAQVLEIQVVENLQRDDLTALEEADGYAALMQHSQISADQVGEKIGKSRSYIYARLKLLDLCTEVRDDLRAGNIDASRALLIARVPNAALQRKALDYTVKASGYPPEPPSVRALQGWLQQNVMLHLKDASFKPADAYLVEAAGSCTQCPKRTGANPDLFTDVPQADICTDPPCYHRKQDAHRASLLKQAEAKGLRIVQDQEAMELLDRNHHRPLPHGYTRTSQPRPDLGQDGDRVTTLGQALGKNAPAPILFVHPKTQEVSELVPSDEAEAVLLAKGLLKAPQPDTAQTAQLLEQQLTHLKNQITHRTQRAQREALHTATFQAIRASSTSTARQLLNAPEVLRAYLIDQLDTMGSYEFASAIGYELDPNADEDDAVSGHVRRMGDTDLMRATALAILDQDNPAYTSAGGICAALAKELGLDAPAIEATAAAQVKTTYADELRTLQAQLNKVKKPAEPKTAKPDLPLSPAAQARGGAGGAQDQTAEDKAQPKLKKNRPAAPTAKPKATAEETKQGIAAALQGLESAALAAEGSNPGADAQGIEASALALAGASETPAQAPPPMAVELGCRVRVLTGVKGPNAKYAGKEGLVRSRLGAAWMLMFTGKGGKVGSMASFDRNEIEVVE